MTIEHDGDSAADTPCQGGSSTTLQHAIGVLAGKWKGEILRALIQGKQRFGALRRAIPGVTQHMLTMQLRDLEANGLVKRTVYAEVPPRVEYEMTPSAKALKPVFDELFKWSQEHGFPTGPQPRPTRDDEIASQPAAPHRH
ncbi:winged helix-turn-helix transcriptional regulator [Rhodopseudomonas telluris]|uniref:Winged helix-turn-helix transcriptional regulator n=1 Tax=Rhodopseudomonas telluris TaxID=644215 RepID=A0ABV6ERY3_9BRAD